MSLTTYDWALRQLDVQNDFLHGDLEEEVYMEQPPSNAVIEFGLRRSVYDHSVFYSSSNAGCILLVVYVDDTVITDSDKAGIKKLKSFIDLLDDAGQIEAKPYDEPMIPQLKLRSKDRRLLHNHEKYRRVVGKLNYLTITPPDIAFSLSVLSWFLTAPRTSHWDVVTRILGYLKGTLGLGILYANHGQHIAEGFTDADYARCPNTSRSTTGYCVFVGGNLRSKEDDVLKISTSVFVTNLPDRYTAKDLWNTCKTYGHVVDAYIPDRRSEAGKRFGFVRFINVFDVERL
nr:hypothetical protein [Tanacetum cinerariifolium]